VYRRWDLSFVIAFRRRVIFEQQLGLSLLSKRALFCSVTDVFVVMSLVPHNTVWFLDGTEVQQEMFR
jgi:hypothetical protein